MCVHCVQEKRRLQTQLSRTTNEKERRELDMMIAEKEEEIKRRKEGVQHQEELINMIESDIQGYMEVKGKGTVFNMHTIYYVMIMN